MLVHKTCTHRLPPCTHILTSMCTHAWPCGISFMPQTCCNALLSLNFLSIWSLSTYFWHFQGLLSYLGRGNSKTLFEWHRSLTTKTKAWVRAAGFEPLLCLLPNCCQYCAGQALAKRWWDTTHTIHIVEREMIVTLYDFHRMIGMRSSRHIISLEGESGMTLRLELLGRAYPS